HGQFSRADFALERAALDDVQAEAPHATAEDARQREAIWRHQTGPRKRVGNGRPRLRLRAVSDRLIADLDDNDFTVQREGELAGRADRLAAGDVFGATIGDQQLAGRIDDERGGDAAINELLSTVARPGGDVLSTANGSAGRLGRDAVGDGFGADVAIQTHLVGLAARRAQDSPTHG